MSIYNLFPTPIGIIDSEYVLTEDEMRFIIEGKRHYGDRISFNHNILHTKDLTSLRSWLDEQIHKYLNITANPKYNTRLRITQSWINYSNLGEHHRKHDHPNSYISGVFYIQTNKSDKIYFYRDHYQQFKILSKNFNEWNSESWWYEAIRGRLIVFPSHLIHMVPEVEENLTRISISFNTFPIGVLGHESYSTELNLET